VVQAEAVGAEGPSGPVVPIERAVVVPLALAPGTSAQDPVGQGGHQTGMVEGDRAGIDPSVLARTLNHVRFFRR
jgi:hypothetical protein